MTRGAMSDTETGTVIVKVVVLVYVLLDGHKTNAMLKGEYRKVFFLIRRGYDTATVCRKVIQAQSEIWPVNYLLQN